ncbi:MAG: hypothetical protein K9K88_04415 [Desulfobacterales bacterium]|nr:hypothetical protein [Desulfobacterales bacterium]
MKTSIIATALSLLIITWGTGYAGSYELIKGQDLEVCQVYEKYINSFDTDEPMICERPYSEDFPMIERPNWIEVDVNENMDWLMGWYEVQKGIDLSTMTKRSTKQKLQDAVVEATEAKIVELKKQARNGLIKMYLSDIDIDNNGSEEKILRIDLSPEAGGCAINAFGYYRSVVAPATLLALDENHNIDYRFTIYTIATAPKTIFFYNGTTFYDLWGGLSTYVGTKDYEKTRYTPNIGGGGIVIDKPEIGTGKKNMCELLYKITK